TYAIKTNLRHFGYTPPIYAVSEFAFNNQLPQLLRLSGYKATLFRTHVTNYGYQRPFDCVWGLWVGRDGTEIPAAPTTTEQGQGYFNCTIDNWVITRWPSDAKESLEDLEKTCEKYEPLLFTRYDDLVLRNEALVARAQEMDNCKFVILEEIPEIYGDATEKFVTDENDFHGRMPWGYCGNEVFNGCRQGENNAAAAEKINAAAVLFGGSSAEADLEEAWRNVLVAQHHDIFICGLLDDARRFIPASLAASARAEEESFRFLASRLASPEKEGVAVFNPMAFPVTAWIETEANGNASAFMNGKELDTEVSGSKLRIRAELPGLTAARIDVSEKASEKSTPGFGWENGVLDTPLYRLVLNEKGIVSIFDKTVGKTVVDNGRGKLFLSCINDSDCESLGTWEITLSAHSARAVSTGKIGTVPYRFEMEFSADAPILCRSSFDIDDQLIGKIGLTKGLSDPLTVNNFVHETKLRIAFDLNFSRDRKMYRDAPFSLAQWDGQVQRVIPSSYKETEVLADIKVSPEESFNDVTYLQGIYWFALRDENAGFAFINRGCMGSSVEGNSVSVPLIYSNDYIWNPRYLHGTYSNEFAILPLGGLSDAELHRIALAYQQPLRCCRTEKGTGTDLSLRAAELLSKGGEVILTALYP
ncbi:MAG: hypothetical protein IKZ19_06810, partial [Clostridia bacterium]|nr:hypothetical protein [Clostridia bacterium]